MIKGGYILQPRKIDESDIQECPPHVREIWLYLLRKANHRDTPNKKLQKGQLLTSYKKIINDLSWKVGYRTENYKKHHCETAMKVLTRLNMITTTKTTRGIIVTICNYEYYQNPKNYENHNGNDNKTTTKPQSTDTIDKNGKNEKNEKNNINIPFEKFWDLYDKKVDRAKCEPKWKKLKDSERESIMQYIPKYKKSEPNKKYRKNPETFLNKRSWENEIIGDNKKNNTLKNPYK